MGKEAFNCAVFSSPLASGSSQFVAKRITATKNIRYGARRSQQLRVPLSPTCILLPPSLLNVTADFSAPAVSGSFGDIFFGSLENGEPVVLKRARSSGDARALFSREREINSRLRDSYPSSVHWPAYLGTYRRQSQTFLVWRRVGTGKTLEHYLSSCAPNALGEALGAPSPAGARLRISLFMKAVRQLLLATADLHDRGIVHRDLKPDNIIVVPSARRLQIIDFGSALDVRTPLWRRRAIHTIDPLYAAPETRVSVFAPDRFDVFSIALIALRILMPSMSTYEMSTFRTNLLSYDCNLARYRSDVMSGGFNGGVADAQLKTLFNQNDPSADVIFDVLSGMLMKAPTERSSAKRVLSSLVL